MFWGETVSFGVGKSNFLALPEIGQRLGHPFFRMPPAADKSEDHSGSDSRAKTARDSDGKKTGIHGFPPRFSMGADPSNGSIVRFTGMGSVGGSSVETSGIRVPVPPQLRRHP